MRKKIFCILSNLGFLEATSGDRINEINTYRALSVNYDVYYNNRKLDFNDTKYFGTNKRDKVSTPKMKYDLYYVRNNEELFKRLPKPKIYFCVPNQQDCFKLADGLVFPTKSWLKLLKEGNLDEFKSLYNKDDYLPKNLIEFNQVSFIDDLKDHIRTKYYRELFQGDFVIGHFGRVVKGNKPSEFIEVLDKFIEENPTKRISVIFSGDIRCELPSNIRVLDRIPKEDIKYAISACDVLLYHQDYQGNFAGSLKIIDAMSYGVPIISPRYKARMDELGEKYKLYCELTRNKIDKQSLLSKLNFAITNPNELKEISEYLKQRADYYTLDNTAERYKNQLDKII